MSDNESDATPRTLVRPLSYLFLAVLVLSTSLGWEQRKAMRERPR